jgi:hypothetical protein
MATVTPPNLPPINDQTLPAAWTIDLRVDKGFRLYKNYSLSAFVEIRNLTDEANIIVDDDNRGNFDAERYDTSDDPAGQFADPDFYSTPRRILLGMQLLF